MFGQVTPRSFLWLASIWAVLTIGIIGCGGDDDDNEWVGTWELDSIDGESFEQALGDTEELEIDLSISANDWRFNNDGTMEWEFTMRFEVKEEGLTISAEGSIRMMGTYSLSGSNYTLTPTEVEGTGVYEGEIEELISPTEKDTGTWSTTGNTLTLNSDDGGTIVFKKK